MHNCTHSLFENSMFLRKAIGELLRFFWNQKILCWLLFPFMIFFRLANAIRLCIARLFPVPLTTLTCVIGNLRVGGTGKTPFVIWLVNQLQAEGYCVGIVSYPYLAPLGQRAPIVAMEQYCYQTLGDEAALIGTVTQCPIAVGSSRAHAAQALIETVPYHLDFIIFDDGLQCPYLNPTIKIALFQNDHGNGHCLPMGPLRAPWESLDAVDFLYRVSNSPDLNAAIVKKNIDYAIHHSTGEKKYLTQWTKAAAIIAIAYPQTLIAHIKKYILDLDLYLFEDHQPLDSVFYKVLCHDHDVIVTQKEWIKMKDFLIPSDRIWIIPLELEIDRALKKDLLRHFKEKYREHASS